MRLRSALSLAALLMLHAFGAAAETRWYRIEVLAFSQAENSKQRTLRPAPRLPKDVRVIDDDRLLPATLGQLELMQPSPVARASSDATDEGAIARWVDAQADAATTIGMNARLAELIEWQPPARKPPATATPVDMDPLVAAQIAETERLERERKWKITQTRAFALPSSWAYRALPPRIYQLRTAAARLATKSGYQILLHRAWLQPLRSNEDGVPVLVPGVAGSDATGVAELKSMDTPLLTLSLWRPPLLPASALPPHDGPHGSLRHITTLHASVRAVSGKTYYLDAPGIGALVRVDYVNRDVADELAAW